MQPETQAGTPAVDASPPAYLPRAPKLFWAYRPDFESIELVDPSSQAPVLERIGPPPFPRTGFPFFGFLATVYEHVTQHVQRG